MKRLFLFAVVLIAAPVLAGCAAAGEVRHSDYGYCERSVRHRHNDHVFLADYHDHSLCEWLKYD